MWLVSAIRDASGLRLLSLSDGAEPFDVTDVYELEQSTSLLKLDTPALLPHVFPTPSHQTAIKPLLNTLSTANMQANLAQLTAFNNRYYKSTTGAQASTWILNTVKTIASGRSDITASLFAHSWVQSSIIVKIAGSKTPTAPVTILGAHMDSINLSNPTNGRAPAPTTMDRSVNLIEAFRALVASGFKPSTPVEFHWYSGEEAGLLGSQAIATKYKSAGTQVKAFMELDMSGYLNTFLKSLIDTYSSIPWAMDIPCGYACSDHASWYKVGFPSSFPYEASGDTTSVTGFSWAHSLEFAKIGVAFVYELAA
ncbi:hypothetical protein BD779DRAFT_1608978 [Infundibulicybe gibba]|nr:hypothetical protein BD779DRAFT_1608978 [Infundibulicybe gibba]